MGSTIRPTSLLRSAEGILVKRSVEGRVTAFALGAALAAETSRGMETGLFAASPTVLREVMGLLEVGLAPGLAGVSVASRLAGG